MSQYTTDEVLRMMERWHEQHKEDEAFDDGVPFKGFDGLMDADLGSIDLGRSTIALKANLWQKDRPGQEGPPWQYWLGGGLDLRGAELSVGQAPGINLSRAQLQGANFDGARLRGATFQGTDLQGSSLKEAQLDGASFGSADLMDAQLQHAQLEGAAFHDARSRSS